MSEELSIPGLRAPLRVRRSTRARRFALRVRPQDGTVELVLPERANLQKAAGFVVEHRDWIGNRQAATPPRATLEAGHTVPLLGGSLSIRHVAGRRGGAWIEGDELLVSGDPQHTPRRVRDFLKAEARRQIAPRAHEKAERIGRRIRAITVRDTASRWGSCSHDGRLSFSWRLVLTPLAVLDYVIAHEVAHLAEMNHGPRFWRLVESLTPDHAIHRDWLKRHGLGLSAYG